MKLGSHNSLSYITPKKWYFKLFHFTAKCLTVDYKELYEKYGVRVFDIRIWFDENMNIEVRHGLIAFKIDNSFIEDFLTYLNEKGDCYLRVLLEEDNFNKKDKNVIEKESKFYYWCIQHVYQYKNIIFFGGQRKYDWKRIVNFEHKDLPLIDRYSSTTSLFKSDSKFLRVIDDLWPWLYARINNKKSYEEFENNEDSWLFIDFVNIK